MVIHIEFYHRKAGHLIRHSVRIGDAFRCKSEEANTAKESQCTQQRLWEVGRLSPQYRKVSYCEKAETQLAGSTKSLFVSFKGLEDHIATPRRYSFLYRHSCKFMF